MPKYKAGQKTYITTKLDEKPKVTIRHVSQTSKDIKNTYVNININDASEYILGEEVISPLGKIGKIVEIKDTKFIVDLEDCETYITIDSFYNNRWRASSEDTQIVIDRLIKNDIHSKDFININKIYNPNKNIYKAYEEDTDKQSNEVFDSTKLETETQEKGTPAHPDPQVNTNDISDNIPTNRPLGMKWFNFFYRVRCVLGIIFAIPSAVIYFSLSAEQPLMILLAILCIPMVISEIIAILNYFKHYPIGYYPISMYYSTLFILSVDAISALCSLNIFYIISFLIFTIFNFNYFTKRKLVFYSKDEIKKVKTLELCNTCKYNEHTFCKYKDCENCPNWKKDPSNKNNYYCMCDEYEQSNNEQCPYYIPAEESPNVDEEENNNDDTPIEEKFSNYLSTAQSIEDDDTK